MLCGLCLTAYLAHKIISNITELSVEPPSFDLKTPNEKTSSDHINVSPPGGTLSSRKILDRTHSEVTLILKVDGCSATTRLKIHKVFNDAKLELNALEIQNVNQ